MYFRIIRLTKESDMGSIGQVKIKKIQFLSGNSLMLRGFFIPSENNKDNKTIFLVNAMGNSVKDLIQHIELLVNAGYHVFTYDQRSHGESDTGMLSYGPNEGSDLLAALKYVKDSELPVNMNKLGAIGFSLRIRWDNLCLR